MNEFWDTIVICRCTENEDEFVAFARLQLEACAQAEEWIKDVANCAVQHQRGVGKTSATTDETQAVCLPRFGACAAHGVKHCRPGFALASWPSFGHECSARLQQFRLHKELREGRMPEVAHRMRQRDLDAGRDLNMADRCRLIGQREPTHLNIVREVHMNVQLARDSMEVLLDHDLIGVLDGRIKFRLLGRGLQACRPERAVVRIAQINEEAMRILHGIVRPAIQCDPVEKRSASA